MLVEMHALTSRHSPCSFLDPVTLVRRAVKKGLHGFVITEHNYLWGAYEIDRLRQEAEPGESFLPLVAQEANTDIGHVLVYGADRSIEERMSIEELRKIYPQAALVWAHPLRRGNLPTRAPAFRVLFEGLLRHAESPPRSGRPARRWCKCCGTGYSPPVSQLPRI